MPCSIRRLDCLDGLRGVLAIYIMLGHLLPFAVVPAWLLNGIEHGEAAVDVFFILSGLVISQSLSGARGQPAPFLLGRMTRIFPVFLPVFALAVLIDPPACGFDRMPWVGPDSAARMICSTGWPTHGLAEVLAHLTMTHGLFPNGVLPHVWIDLLGPAWSLSTEWQFYIVALLLSRAGVRRLGNAGQLVGGLMLLALIGVVWREATPEGWHFSRAFLANKAQFFALGVASLGVVQGRPRALLTYAGILAMTVAVCASAGVWFKMLAPLVWTCCLLVQMRPQTTGLGWCSRLLRCRAAQYAGAISYCLYIVNEPIHKGLALGLSWLADGDARLFTVLWLPSAILLPVGVAVLLHVHVEMPALRWGRGKASTMSRAALQVTPVVQGDVEMSALPTCEPGDPTTFGAGILPAQLVV